MSILINGMEMPSFGNETIIRIQPDGSILDQYGHHLLDCKAIPATDMRPVVLCQECYAYRRDKELAEAAYLDPEMYCGLLCCEMGEDSFCSYGKRKDKKS